MNEWVQGLRAMTEKQLGGCILRAYSGIPLYTPDGMGNYRALWTRDFAYMLEYAGELIPLEHAVADVEYLLAGAGEDGWIPDRVGAGGLEAGVAALPLDENGLIYNDPADPHSP